MRIPKAINLGESFSKLKNNEPGLNDLVIHKKYRDKGLGQIVGHGPFVEHVTVKFDNQIAHEAVCIRDLIKVEVRNGWYVHQQVKIPTRDDIGIIIGFYEDGAARIKYDDCILSKQTRYLIQIKQENVYIMEKNTENKETPKTYQVDEAFIKDAYEVACPLWKDKIKTKFPEVFPSPKIIGKTYIPNDNSYSVCIETGESVHKIITDSVGIYGNKTIIVSKPYEERVYLDAIDKSFTKTFINVLYRDRVYRVLFAENLLKP